MAKNTLRLGNSEGNGFAIGTDDMTPLQAAEDSEYTNIEEDEIGQVLCTDGEDIIIIRDHNGPWAIRIPAVDLD